MYDSRLISLKCRSASLFLVERLVDNGFNSFPVTLYSRTGYPRGKIIHESDYSSLAVDLSLHEVCIKKQK